MSAPVACAVAAPPAPAPQGRFVLRVARVEEAALGIRSIELVAPAGGALPRFEAGAHLSVHLRGDGGLCERHYSLCNAPADTGCYRLGVLLEPASRGGSRAMHALRVGDLLEVSGPRNHFPLQTDARPPLLLAGGIGITPMLAMALQLTAQARPFALHYWARSRAHVAFAETLAACVPAPGLQLHLDDDPPAQRLGLAELLARQTVGTPLYLCGPGGFLDAGVAAARAGGWDAADIRLERFGAAVPELQAGDATFSVRAGPGGKTVEVPPGQSIADALAAAGVHLPISCAQGICGTCLTGVLAGEPDHRDQYLTAAERAANDCMLVCCSRARTPLLVLDL